MNKADEHVFTSNEVWKQVTCQNILHNTEALTGNFHKPTKYAAESEILIIKIYEHFSKLSWSSELQMLGYKSDSFYNS